MTCIVCANDFKRPLFCVEYDESTKDAPDFIDYIKLAIFFFFVVTALDKIEFSV